MDSITLCLTTYFLTAIIAFLVAVIIKIIVFYIHRHRKSEEVLDEQIISSAVNNDVEIALAIALAKKGK